MMLLRLFGEFFRTGLFAIGGGLATVPFLSDLGVRTGWFTQLDLADMIAVSESTPGPLGINMATYVGFRTWGVPGAAAASLGLVAPSILIALLISRFLVRFRDSRLVDATLYGLRPASAALIAAACLSVARIALTTGAAWTGLSGLPAMLSWPAVALAAAVFACTQIKPTKSLHPVLFIGISALVGIVFQL